MAETEVVSLNLAGNFASQASAMASGADKLTSSVDRMNTAMGAVKGPDIGGHAAFSSASDADFKRSKWEGWKPTESAATKPTGAPKTGGGAAAGGAGGKSDLSGVMNLGSGLKLVARQAGIGRAALAALGTAAVLEATKLAVGYRGMAQLQAISLRTSMAIRQLFRGVDPMPLVRAYDSFTRLFSKSSATGVYLTGLFSRVFNTLFGGIEKAEPAAEAFFKGMIIGAQQVEIAWLQLQIALVPLTTAIEDAIGPIGDMETASTAGMIAVGALGVAAAAAASPFVALAAAIAATSAALKQAIDLKKQWDAASIGKKALHDVEDFSLAGLLGTTRRGREQDAQEKGRAAFEAVRGNPTGSDLFGEHGPIDIPLQPTKGPDVGGNGIGASGKASGAAYGQGVAAGARSTMGDVSAAGDDLATGIDDGFRTKAKIRSPSRMAYDSASYIPDGMVNALGDGRGDVQAAASRLAPRMPNSGAGGTGRGTASAGGAQVVVQHNWPAGVDRARRAEIEDAAEAGTLRALAIALGVPVTP